jgi:outer membrane receptor protein involved in Fe transport
MVHKSDTEVWKMVDWRKKIILVFSTFFFIVPVLSWAESVVTPTSPVPLSAAPVTTMPATATATPAAKAEKPVANQAAPAAETAPVNSSADPLSELILFQEIPQVAGTLVQKDATRSPVSITVIDEEKLRLTPAKNLYDILEVYVPGFIYYTHYDSSHMALRGQAGDRDYQFLLLVDGHVVNQKSHDGALTELENWDLNYIYKVEVIRGPGSVTYGPGAVAGVISITTKNAATAQGTQLGVQGVSGYRSLGAYASQALQGKDLGFYLYGSCSRTHGYKDPSILTFSPATSEALYVPSNNGQILDYDTDANDQPQVKINAELDFLKEWKAWARFLNSGTSRIVTWTDSTGSSFQKKLSSAGNGWLNNPQTRVKQADLALENDHVFDPTLDLKTSLMGTSIDNKRQDTEFLYHENYSETDATFNSTLRYTPFEAWKSALGIEAEYNHLGAAWGESSDNFIMEDGMIFLNKLDSPQRASFSYLSSGTFIPVMNTDLYSYSILAETSYSVLPQLDIMASGRLDKSCYEPWAFSPRVSLIYDADAAGLYKLSYQRSVRDNTLITQAALKYLGADMPDQEKYTGMEFIYSNPLLTKVLNLANELSVFYSDARLLGWSTGVVDNGELKTAGLELTLEYKTDDSAMKIGGNFSYCKELSYTLPNGLTSSYVSNTDPAETGFTGGTDRMNWPNKQAKLYTIIKLMDKLTLFADMRYIWGFEGNSNWLTSQGNHPDTPAVDYRPYYYAAASYPAANEAFLRSQGIYDNQFRFDLSLSYELIKNLSVTVFGQNLIRATHQWRYMYVMQGGAATDEPSVGGLKIGYKF